MNKKEPLLIAVDMDGTLLNEKKKISLKTLFLLRKLAKKGNKIIISSGRPIRGIDKYYKLLGLDTPMICYNGEQVYSPCDKNFNSYTLTLDKNMLIDVVKKLGKEAISIMCENNEEIWIDKEDMFLDRFFKYEGMKINKGNFVDILNNDGITFICKTTEEYKNSEKLNEIIKEYEGISYIYWIGSPYFELHHKNACKGSGIKYIANYYNIPKENIIAFGDSTNDIEMFDEAGVAVLMSNSKKNITNITMRSLKDNNHNGIYYTLKKILKN